MSTVGETVNTPETPNSAVTASPVDKSENETPKKTPTSGQKPKAKKRKKLRDLTAPRQPLTGYVRFLNDRRDQFRAENPNMTFSEITKMLAAEWTALPHDQKQQYLLAAEQDRERYLQEMAAYKQSDAYRIFSEQQQQQQAAAAAVQEGVSSKRIKEEGGTISQAGSPANAGNQQSGAASGTANSAGSASNISGGSAPANDSVDSAVVQSAANAASSILDIPIFTEEFLDHNKSREAELRQLRKSNTDYEQQNATIQTYLTGLHAAIDKLGAETQQQKASNVSLGRYLNHLRTTFSQAFVNIHVPGLETPTVDTIDQYIVKVIAFIKEDWNHPAVGKIRTAVSQLDLHHN